MESHGKEGGLAPAGLERHSSSGGKPPFLTCKFAAVAGFHGSGSQQRSSAFSFAVLISILLVAFVSAEAASTFEEYEGRLIRSIEITFEGSPADPGAQAEFLSLLAIVPNTEFSAVGVRDSLQALFVSERVANARVEVFEEGAPKTGPLRLRFVITRQVQIGDIRLDLVAPTGTPVSEDELRARLNLTQPGARLSHQVILRNSDELQVYLRDRGYFNATIETAEQLDPSGTRATVTYKIVPGEQSRVAAFNIDITGFDVNTVRPSLALQPNAPFTREALGQDTNRIRQAVIEQGNLSPLLNEARVERDPEKNQITITLKGVVGPKVNVIVKDFPLSEKTQRELLPVKREGNIDISAIVEGSRRLRNKFQEDGYFFAEVSAVCTVTPPTPEFGENGTSATCETLNPETLTGRNVEIRYEIEPGRRLKLTDIRITGTNKLTFDDVAADLRTQKASAIGLIPFLGYGRGYTSLTLLEQDRRTIDSYMRDIGYRRVQTKVLQGVSVDGESVIITFEVNEGPLTRIAGAEVRGNKIYTDQRLRDQLKTVIGAPFSRSQARADGDRVLALYSREGYLNAQIDFSIVELPKRGDEEQVKLLYTIANEGDKVYVNHIIVNGVTGSDKAMRTKRAAILRVIPLAEGDVLRADRIAESERELYLTDAYRQVIIRTEAAGETISGFKRRDLIIDVEEKKPRVMDYGGGFSTDTGALGLLEISNVNLRNKLRHGAMRLRASRQQQRVRLEYLDPRFARYGERQFAPLGLSLEYSRDSTVTRFFRSAIDRGTMGIVQRLDEEGNALDEFGLRVNEPTINRFTATIETQRVLNSKTRSILFARYSYEDVRLFNLQSLLVRPILEPDRAVRLSRFGVSFVRDTRQRCERGLLGAVSTRDESETGAPGEVCRYNQLDATRGDFFNIDYAVALRQLGGNISFNRMQATYRRYYKLGGLRGTVLAGNATLGLANVFSPRDRNGNGLDEIDLTLPISERFSSGGSTTLRGFDFEQAGPRQVIIPAGPFIDQNKEPVILNPFTVPVGGNALAIINLEARIPVSKSLQAVPFYDGGNVFRRVGDLFGKKDPAVVPPGDVLAAINAANLRAAWTNTVGLGFRIQTPFGGALAVDYGFLLNPPEFLIPQRGPGGIAYDGTPAIYRLKRTQLHFRFTQTF
ncbi:MAG: BamA/TamA family outer membrane protein [Pyrinomonadaceae bacterium]|nr:BamA/TamA family outer membrane protein [Pyrinomonadaceae bacterium]